MCHLATPLEKEITAIRKRLEQLKSNPSFPDGVIYEAALLIAESRQKFEKDHPGEFFEEHFQIGFTSLKDDVVVCFVDDLWNCYCPGSKIYGEEDSNLVNLLNKFFHVN